MNFTHGAIYVWSTGLESWQRVDWDGIQFNDRIMLRYIKRCGDGRLHVFMDGLGRYFGTYWNDHA